MNIKISYSVEKQLRNLAIAQGREIGVLVEEALRAYVEKQAITDPTSADVGETQVALMGELAGISAWKDGSA